MNRFENAQGLNHKFYLLKIEKASSNMGFNYVSEVLTPDSEAASEDAVISVANIFSFVKNYDSNNAKEKPYMQPWKGTVPSALLPLRLCLLVVTELIRLIPNQVYQTEYRVSSGNRSQ